MKVLTVLAIRQFEHCIFIAEKTTQKVDGERDPQVHRHARIQKVLSEGGQLCQRFYLFIFRETLIPLKDSK